MHDADGGHNVPIEVLPAAEAWSLATVADDASVKTGYSITSLQEAFDAAVAQLPAAPTVPDGFSTYTVKRQGLQSGGFVGLRLYFVQVESSSAGIHSVNSAARFGGQQAARLRWRELAPAAAHAIGQLKLAGGSQYGLAQSIALAGIPEVPGANPLDEALVLLKTAAEVEHALLIQYLYAAFSVRDDHRKTLMLIAHQEMGHLITVQNLRLLCGAAPYMNRQDARSSA